MVQNISNPLEAWLTFLSSDDSEQIVRLVNAYLEFLDCYQDIVRFRANPKELILMYSEALLIMDRNTTQLMTEDMQETITQLQEDAAKKDEILAQKDDTIAQKDEALAQKDSEISDLKAELARLRQHNN